MLVRRNNWEILIFAHPIIILQKILLKNTYTVDTMPTVFANGETDEYCVERETNGFISEVTVGGENKWCMLGHVYFDRAFSKKFVRILENELNIEAFKEQLWEEYYYRHLDELKLEALIIQRM